jgi:hypothetical protein
MSRALRSVVPMLVGGFLSAPALLPGFSLSNVVNLMQVVVGGCLVIFGVIRWNAPTLESAQWEAPSGAPRTPDPPNQPKLGAGVSSVRQQVRKSPVRRWYLAYLMYFVLLPLLVTVATMWISKTAGCHWSAATMEVRGCGVAGRFFTEMSIYLGLFFAAMLSVLIPATVVYVAAVLSERKAKKR